MFEPTYRPGETVEVDNRPGIPAAVIGYEGQLLRIQPLDSRPVLVSPDSVRPFVGEGVRDATS